MAQLAFKEKWDPVKLISVQPQGRDVQSPSDIQVKHTHTQARMHAHPHTHMAILFHGSC